MKFFRRLGIGLGKMKLLVPRLEFVLGEQVEGELIYRLTEPTQGLGLEVQLEAWREIEKEDERERESLYQRSVQLGGEQVYSSGQGRFSLPLPPPAPAREPAQGLLAALWAGPEPEVHWQLEARLSIHFSAPLRDRLTLVVGRPAAGQVHASCPLCGLQGAPGDRFCGSCGTALG